MLKPDTVAERNTNHTATNRPASGSSVVARVGMRFLLTGLLVNGTLVILFAILLRFGVDYRISASATYVLGVIWGYIQNRIWSWKSRAPIIGSAARYVVVYFGIYVLHLGLISVLVELFGVPALLAVMISIGGLIVPVFVILDRFVFARNRS